MEVTFEILVNYHAEAAAAGRGMLACPANSVLVALGVWEALHQLLGSGRKFPQHCRWMGMRRIGGKWRWGREREMHCNGITLHSAFCNNENYPLCLQC